MHRPTLASPSKLAQRARVFLGPGLLFLGLVTVQLWAGSRVGHGIRVCELSLAYSTRAELETELGQLEQRLRKAKLSVELAGHVFELPPERVGFRLDVERTARAALNPGTSLTASGRVLSWFTRWTSPRTLDAVVTIDVARLGQVLEEWERAALPDRPFQGGLRVSGDHFVVDAPRAGTRIDRAAAQAAISEALGRERNGSVKLRTERFAPTLDRATWQAALKRAEALTSAPVELANDEFRASLRLSVATLRGLLRVSVEPGKPERLVFALEEALLEPELLALQKSIGQEPRDAQFFIDEHDQVSIVPSRSGARLELGQVAHAVLEAAESPSRTGALPVRIDRAPAFRTEDAAALHIDKLVSTFTTFHPCCQPRVQNIHRIADLLNGVLVRPGQTLSLNAVVGERTQKNGFVPAPSIQDGEMVDTVGGGVSQFATTFFNAVFYGGYDIIERQSHTYWFSRYPMGHEATLSWPKPDLIFRNDTDAGVLIKTAYTEKSVTVKLFGNNGGRVVKATVSPKQDIIKPEVELIPNAEVPVDEEKVKEAGMIGWSVIVGRQLTFPNGQKKVEQRKVTYKPRIRRVEVHPCRIPEGEPGYTGERCPPPEEDAGAEAPEAPPGAR